MMLQGVQAVLPEQEHPADGLMVTVERRHLELPVLIQHGGFDFLQGRLMAPRKQPDARLELAAVGAIVGPEPGECHS